MINFGKSDGSGSGGSGSDGGGSGWKIGAPTSLATNMEFFFLNVLLKVFLFLKVCDRDQVELEAMVLDYPKFYNHEYCCLVVIFHSSPM